MTIDTNLFGYHLIRNDILRDILGNEHDNILYFIGKSLARKYPLETNEQLAEFFTKANWGELNILKEKRQKMIYELTGSWMGQHDKRCYQLEAGFLAEQTELSRRVISAATYLQKKDSVIFTIEFDRYDSTE
ncbi:YslB family protein [bacterium LRH843]|nr:YslB family protein [bacterium LRH843]